MTSVQTVKYVFVMKKIVLMSALALALWSCSGPGFEINGSLSNAEGAKVMLYEQQLWGMTPLDSAVVKDGAFYLSGRLESPVQCCMLVFLDADGDISFSGDESEALAATVYMDNSSVTFSADANTLPTYYWSEGRKTVPPVVTGSVQQDLKEELDSLRKPLSDSLAAVGKMIYEVYYAPEVENDFSEKGAELAAREMALLSERHKITMDFVRCHPEAAVSFDEVAYLFGDGSVSPYTAEEIADYVSVLEPQWQGTKRFAALKEAAESASKLAVGEKYVDAEFYDMDGNKVKLSSYIPEGKIAMLEFWASWCGPCRAEIPHLKHIHKKYPEFDIISVSVDDNDQEWKKAVKEENMDWIQLKDVSMINGNAMNLYGVMGVPCCIILDEQGRFLKTNMRGPYLDAFLRDYYGR